MNSRDRSNGLSARPQRWLTLCVVIGLVVGAGGLLPSLLSGSSAWPASGGSTSNGGPESIDLPASPSPAAMLGRLAAGTILVLALCAGTLPLLKRWLVASPAAKPGGAFEVVASLKLNGRCCVCLVRAGGQHLLAGTDAAGLQALVPVGDVPADGELPLPEALPPRRVPAGIEPRRLTAV
jgi:hypothetical protein